MQFPPKYFIQEYLLLITRLDIICELQPVLIMIIICRQVGEYALLPLLLLLLLRLPSSLREKRCVHKVVMHVPQTWIHCLSIVQSIVCGDTLCDRCLQTLD